jgi:hypothetical protein
MIMWAARPQRGPASPPGEYTVRVTADGQSATRTFRVGLDPRLAKQGITEADLHEQYKLSVRVRDRVSEANNAVTQIRSIREQVNERLAKVPERRRREIQALVRNRSSQDPLNYPIKLNNKIAALSGVIESSDSKPTDQTYEVFKELSALLEEQLARRDATLKSELQRLNAALRREKLDPVDPSKKPAPPAAKPANPTQ